MMAWDTNTLLVVEIFTTFFFFALRITIELFINVKNLQLPHVGFDVVHRWIRENEYMCNNELPVVVSDIIGISIIHETTFWKIETLNFVKGLLSIPIDEHRTSNNI